MGEVLEVTESHCFQQLREQSRRWLNDALECLRKDGALLDLDCISIDEIEGIHTGYFLQRVLVDRQIRNRRRLLVSIHPVDLPSCALSWDPLNLGFTQEAEPVRFHTHTGSAARPPQFLMFDFLRIYLYRIGILMFDQDCFDETLAEFAEFLFDHGEILVEAKAFVINLSLGSRSKQFQDGVVLRAVSEEEHKLIVDISTEWRLPNPWLSAISVVEITEKAGQRSSQKASDDFWPRITAVQKAVIRAVLISTEKPALEGPVWTHSPNPHYLIEARWQFRQGAYGWNGGADAIGDAEWKKLVELVPVLQDSNWDSRVDLALRRLEYSAIRSSDEDKLIDYWIGLEALFAIENDELTHRYSVRIARFLGSGIDKSGRVGIRNAVRDSYNLRSKVAHGSALRAPTQNQLQEMTRMTGEWLRESIRLCLSNFGGKSPDLAQLDDDALS